MATNIETMKPIDILRKEAFRRAIPSEQLSRTGCNTRTGDALALHDPSYDPIRYELLTQSDFLREYDVNAHKINSLKYYPNPLMKDSDGSIYSKIKSRVAVAYQRRIHTKRVQALTGNNASLRLIDGEQRYLDLFRKGWEKKNIETAIHDAVAADGKVGDVAVEFHIHNGSLGWRIFQFEKGDTLYPHYDEQTGELSLFGRRYVIRDNDGKEINEYLDVWDDTYHTRYRKNLYGLKAKLKNVIGIDGWEVDIAPKPHNFPGIPIAYHRYGEPFWAASQSLIDGQEFALSQLSENNLAYALRILYSFGESMDMQATVDGTPWRIDSPDVAAKVGFLEPADASNSFSLQLETNDKNIMRCSFAVETPEIKSGSDMSSLTVKMLFADSYLKALDDAAEYQPFIDKIVECFKYGYFLEIGRISDSNAFSVKAELFPYIFQSETEVINAIVQLKGIGALSRQSASEMAYEYGYGIVDENKRILQEEHDELTGVSPAESQKDVNVVSNARNR